MLADACDVAARGKRGPVDRKVTGPPSFSVRGSPVGVARQLGDEEAHHIGIGAEERCAFDVHRRMGRPSCVDQRGNVSFDVPARMQEIRQDDDPLGAVAHGGVDARGQRRFGELEKRGEYRGVDSSAQTATHVDVSVVRCLTATPVRDEDDGVMRPAGGGGGSHCVNLTGMAETRRTSPLDRHLDEIGVGPCAEPWPVGPHYDPELLEHGDRRNVVDHYRYWSVEAIVADLDRRRHPFHVAIENWDHDFNIGAVVRNANAFLAAEVHIIGRRRWNRRGAMVTDRYQHVRHHETVDSFVEWAEAAAVTIVGIDNLPGSTPLETTSLPESCVMVFGQEGPGLSFEAREAASMVCSITQFGSTRSINAGVASGIAMFAWTTQHAKGDE